MHDLARLKHLVPAILAPALAFGCTLKIRDYGAGGTGGDGGGGAPLNSASSSGGGAPTSSSGGGAPTSISSGMVACTAPQVACGGACVDPAISAAHCGACGHDCGGATCMNGSCQPQTLATNQPGLSNIAIDGVNLFFGTNDDTASNHLAVTCPVTGCVGKPKQLASYGQYINTVAAGNGMVVFQSSPIQATDHPGLYYCPQTGCASNPNTLHGITFSGFSFDRVEGTNVTYYGPGLGLFTHACTPNGDSCAASVTVLAAKNIDTISADATNVYFVNHITSNGTTSDVLQICPDFAPCTPTTLLTLTSPPVKTAAFGGTVYLLYSGQQGGLPGGSIQRCPATGCQGTVQSFVNKQAFPTDLAVDATGVYWINSDDHAIKTCALSACVGGPTTVAQGLTAPRDLALDEKFVYWVDGTSILRVAK